MPHLLAFTCFAWSIASVFGQNNSNIDLAVKFDSPPDEARINSIFGVRAEVFLDGNSSIIPEGEYVTGAISLIDPNGIFVDTVPFSFNGFNRETFGKLSRGYGGWYYPEITLFQIPWSQSSNWESNETKWKIVLDVSVAAGETNVLNNTIEHDISLRLPDVAVNPLSLSMVDPTNGELNYNSEEFVPGTNYSVSGMIQNVGVVMTQANVLMELRAELLSVSTNADGQVVDGEIIDSESILFPPNYKELAYLLPMEQWNFDISGLYLPSAAEGNYSVKVTVNPQDIEGGPILHEEGNYTNNSARSEVFEISNTINNNSIISAKLSYLDDSYRGEQGDFRGLDPIFISFAMRNIGKSPVGESDEISARVVLSKDQILDDNDFILRDFNLGGGGIGEGLLASETVNLTWYQQLPDNFEGDYYLLIEVSNAGETEIFSMDSSPIISLNSSNSGTTELLQTEVSGGTFAERPSVSKDGRYIVFEKSIQMSGQLMQQIYLKDMLTPNAEARLISKAFDHSGGANANSFRPRISLDGSTIVFYSSATDLVPGDTNNKEDIFLYRVSTGTLIRAVNRFYEQLNGRSLYPDVNGDGSIVVFESDATNADVSGTVTGRQIYLWTINQSVGSSTITALTTGNKASLSPSIDETGNRIVFDSYATDLNPNNNFGSDNNDLRDVYLIERNTSSSYLVSINDALEQSVGGPSYNARISGNGKRAVFVSEAQNLILGTGIAKVEVIDGGAGYQGNPTIQISDTDYNASGAPGRGAILSLKENGINALQEINTDGLRIIDAGYGYVNPRVTIIPDPAYPPPSRTASAVAYLSNPDGDIYHVDVDSLILGSNTGYAERVSQASGGTGGDSPSRDPSISWDGNSIVYSTKSSNLLPSSVTRQDGKTFLNTAYELPSAKTILVGGIGEIEIASPGIGYEPGYLSITDLSGIGSGASASYQVDNRGRIVTIDIINPGVDYRLDTTIISVSDPRGGSGFSAGKIKFPQVIGSGINRTGGGRIYKVEMNEFGYGYRIGEDADLSFADIIQFEGDGADLNADGFPDGKINPDRVKNYNGSLFIEQKATIEILSSGLDLLDTKLSIYDKNNSQEPIIFEFTEGTGSSQTSVNIQNKTLVQIRDSLIDKIKLHFKIISGNTDSTIAPYIDQNLTNSTSFDFSALSGRVISSNSASIEVIEQSNMIIRGSGYTKAIPIVNQVPSIYGYSEIRNSPSFERDEELGRMALLSQPDYESDDIYLFNVQTKENIRVSKSSFGTPAGYLENPEATNSQLSNGFPAISGNGRYVIFSSDAFGLEGLSFLGSNQKPSDLSPTRDIFVRDLKTFAVIDPTASLNLLYPSADLNQEFAPQTRIPVIARYEGTDRVEYVTVILNQQVIDRMEEFSAGSDLSGTRYDSGNFSYQLPPLSSGEYVLQIVAHGANGQVLSTSPLTLINVKPFEGSIPPAVVLQKPSSYDKITSTSTIPFSVTARDPDGSIEEVQFYVNGEAYNDPISLPQGLVDDNYIFSILWNPPSAGVYGIHATGLDGSGNLVASEVYYVTATTGNSGPLVSFVSPFKSLDLNASNILTIDDVNGSITALGLPNGNSFIGTSFFSKPKILVSGDGEGAHIIATVGQNPDIPDTYGRITNFEVLNGGSGYDLNSTSISIVPTINTVVPGEYAVVSYDAERNNTDPSQVISASFYIGTDLSGPRQGNGYVVSPRYIVNYPHQGRLPLENPLAGATTSKVQTFNYTTTESAEASFPPMLTGGFAHAPIFFEVNATSPIGNEIIEVGLMLDSQILTADYKPPFNMMLIPDDPGYYNLYAYAKDSFGNFTISEKLTILIQEMEGSNINASFLSPKTNIFNSDSNVFLSVLANSENGINGVEFFFNNKSIGFGEKSSYSNTYSLSYSLNGLPEGEYELSFIARDKNGNQSGVFSSDFTTIEGRQSKVIRVVPKGDFLPTVISPRVKDANIQSDWNGTHVSFSVIDGGQGYRYAPNVIIQGGGGVDMLAQAILENGVISAIDVHSSGSGYIENISLYIEELIDGNWTRRNGDDQAILEPVFDEIDGISAILIVDGGKNFYPEAVPIRVSVDYNDTIGGSGFSSGAIYTIQGVVENVVIDNDNQGTGYLAAPTVFLEGGGHVFREGEAVHIRFVADVGSGAAEVILRANGEEIPVRQQDDHDSRGYAEVVANDPYYDIFWVPDRNPEVGLGKVDGLGTWTFEVAIVDTTGNEQVSEPFEVRVINSLAPSVKVLTPEDNATFIFDPLGSVTLVAEADDDDGVVQYVQFLINNQTTDVNGTASFIVKNPPYLLQWNPDTIGTYSIRAIAVDNGGVSQISKPVQIVVESAIGSKPAADWVFPDEMINRDPFASYFSYWGYGNMNTIFIDNDVEVGAQVPLCIRASDDDGNIISVEYFVNNESIGKVNQRYNGVYSLVWVPTLEQAEDKQAIVYSEVTDNDGNTIRTSVRTFNLGSNLGKEPLVELAYVRKGSGLKFDARVHVTDILDPYSRYGYAFPDDAEVIGSFSLVLLINGVPVDSIGVDALPYHSDYDEMQPVGDPQFSNTLSYDFTDITPLEFGNLTFSALLISRQGEPNYRQSKISNSIGVQLSEDEFFQPELPNLFPQGELLSPQSTQSARAKAELYSGVGPLDPNFGKIKSINLLEIGGGYNPDDLPQVKILGGGGKGAEAEILMRDDGAVAEITILQGGSGYMDGDEITILNGLGSDFLATALVRNGVLDLNQSHTIANGGSGYRVNDAVIAFDITDGLGAQGYVSKVDDNGAVQHILIDRVGQNYNPAYTTFSIVSEQGLGFSMVEGIATIRDGNIYNYQIINHGRGYQFGDDMNFQVNSSGGSGFEAEIDIRNSALEINLTNGGEGYLQEPVVILSGGSFTPGADGRKKPMQITVGTEMTLLANAFDFDGNVKSVRFFGEGNDLGIQTKKELVSILVESPGSGYTAPPNVIVEGGGIDSSAIAVLEPPPNDADGKPINDAPRGIARIIVTQRGNGYSSAPSVIIEGGGGYGAKGQAIIQDRAFITEARELVGGSGRWAMNWTPVNPGSYSIDLEIIDDDGAVTVMPSEAQIIVLPGSTSKVPEIAINTEYNGKSFTSQSVLRFIANARDPDGRMEGVQFYANGKPIGEEIASSYKEDQFQQPYSVEFSPLEAGVFTIYAIARDNSANYVMSDTVTFTTTTGPGEPPEVRIDQPTQAGEAKVNVDNNGAIASLDILEVGSGYVEPPELSIFGIGKDAELEANIDTDINSPTFGQIIPPITVRSGGSGYLPNQTRIEFVGGFSTLTASGEVAKAEVQRLRNIDGTFAYTIILIDGGLGYTSDPRVAFSGAPPGMKATAKIDPATGRVVSVEINDQGLDNQTPYDPVAFFTGGLPYSEVMLNAYAEDPDGFIKEVSFYVNGVLMPAGEGIYKNPDSFSPYQMLWSPEGPGIYELYATVEDSDGNVITSPVIRREATLSQPPTVEFNPRDRAFGFLRPESLNDDGSIRLDDIDSALLPENTLVYRGHGYHSFPEIEFQGMDGLGSGAVGEVILEDGQISGIKIKRDSNDQLQTGLGYPKFKQLTGYVSVETGSDLLVGEGTDFINEILVGQPILLGYQNENVPDLDLGEYTVEGFQSINSLLLTNSLGESVQTDNYKIYTFGTRVIVTGGMNTAAKPILLQQGQELSLGMRAVDPEGTSIRPEEGFTVFINGVVDDTKSVQVSGSGPFYRVLWRPPDIGFYSLRIQAADVDGARGFSQTLRVEVKAGMEPSIKMVSPINENLAQAGDDFDIKFAYPSTAVFTFEAKDLDGIIDNVYLYANSLQIGRWPVMDEDIDANLTASSWREGDSNRFSFSFSPRYAGFYNISASAVDSSGQANFSQIATVEFAAPYRQGSLPPIAEVKYPRNPYELEGENIARPATKEIPAFTSASKIPLVTKAFDQDGGLETLNYYVDGQWINSYTGYIQLLDKPSNYDIFSISDGINSVNFRLVDVVDDASLDPFDIQIIPDFDYVSVLRDTLDYLNSESFLNNPSDPLDVLNDLGLDPLGALSFLGLNRTELPAPSLLEEIIISLEAVVLDKQRNVILEKVKEEISGLKISAEIIGMNGIYLRHLEPEEVTSSEYPQLTSLSERNLKTKGFLEGLCRFPSRNSEEYHYTQLWTPPRPGVFTVYSVALDNSQNLVMSTPVTLRSTLGSSPPTITMTSPASGSQRSVTQVGYHGEAEVNYEVIWGRWGYGYRTGKIAGVSIRDLKFGSGYIAPPQVEFIGSGFGAEAIARIQEDATHPRYGQLIGIEVVNGGSGYYGNTIVEFRGGLGQESIFLNASASDPDGEISNVAFLVNGSQVFSDLTAPYSVQQSFSVGYYEFLALAKDDAGNIVASEPARLNVSTTIGAAPSALMINPLPPLAEESKELGQDYFWNFVREYANEVEQAESELLDLEENFDVTANSLIHLVSRATDSDGNITEVSFYLNNKYLGQAEQLHDSSHYVLPLDLSDFGEQPSYVIQTVIKDNANNYVIPNNPLRLNVLPASGSRPTIKIVVPDPSVSDLALSYPIGSPIRIAVEAVPDEGAIESVAIYANGRFIAEAMADEDANFGKGAYTLEWIPENPGVYRITASVKDNLGTLVYTSSGKHVDIEVKDQIGTLPTVELLTPEQDKMITRGSSVRITSFASEAVGTFDGVQFFIDGDKQYAWSGRLTFTQNEEVVDGTTIEINDGTGNIPFIFEFNDDQQVVSGDEPQILSDIPGFEDKLQLSGSYSGHLALTYRIEVDGYYTIRWSKDDGVTFGDEKVRIDQGPIALGNEGLQFELTQQDYDIGRSWKIVVSPKNTIVPIYDFDQSAGLLRTRNALWQAIEKANANGILEIHADGKGTTDSLYLYSTMSLPYSGEVSLIGTAIKTDQATSNEAVIQYIDNNLSGEYPDNIVRKQSSFGGGEYPFGMTWIADEVGSYSIFSLAKDSDGNGSVTVSKSRLITVVDAAGMLPQVTLSPIDDKIEYSSSGTSVSMSANAYDPDGNIIGVHFYANGRLVDEVYQSPYSSSLDINASGHYEIHAVAVDDDGNEVVSNVERVVVNEVMDSFGNALQLNFADRVSHGGVSTLYATFKSPNGLGTYESDLSVMVFVNGIFADYAIQYPYERPMFWEEDPGYKFSFDLEARSRENYEIEFLVINGNETFSESKTISVSSNPIKDEYEFLKSLWNGLFDRDPEGAEINAYLAGLRNGSMTRPQVIEHIRTQQEFITSRDVLLTYKTLHGVWKRLPIVLENTDQQGYGSMGGGGNSVAAQAAMGMPYTIPEGNATDLGFYEGVEDDHANFASAGTWVDMNSRENVAIYSYPDDIDYFKIKSQNLPDEGILEINQIRNPFGNVAGTTIAASNSILSVFFLDGSSVLIRPSNWQAAWDTSPLIKFELTGLKNVDFYAFATSNLENGLKNYLGATLITLSNKAYQDQANFLTEEEIAQLQIGSRVNDFNPTQAITYQTGSFSYVNRYGQIETHDPASFFHRLFLNKYDQEANPMQASRGVQLLKDGTRSQVDFLQQFASENNIITVGGYNYTTSANELAIPNVPIDAAAFAETALVYSALMGRAPSKAEVAKLTFDPYFEVRPLAERARLILEMPAYTEQFGMPIPEVDFITIRNGQELNPDLPIHVEAVSLGTDRLSGTIDDGKILSVELFANGKSIETLESMNGLYFYEFNVSELTLHGDHSLEVLAKGANGLVSRAVRQVHIGSEQDAPKISFPAHGTQITRGQKTRFEYFSDDLSDGIGYLQINGKTRWSGLLSFGEDLLINPDNFDGSTFTISDGTGRGPVTFEWDYNQTVLDSTIEEPEILKLSGTGSLISSGNYRGIENREYLIEIDGDGNGPSGNDTFRWSIDDGATFNDYGIEIFKDQNFSLGSGIYVEFTESDTFEVGDRWRINVYPNNQVIEIASTHFGTFQDRIHRTQTNLIRAFQRAKNRGLLAIETINPLGVDFPILAGGYLSDDTSLSRSVLLRHDGSYPIVESIEFDKNSMDFDFQDLQPLVVSKKDAWKCELLFNPITFKEGFSYNFLEFEIVLDSQMEIIEINNFKSFDHLIDLVIEQINYVRESKALPIFAHRDDFNQNKVVLRYDGSRAISSTPAINISGPAEQVLSDSLYKEGWSCTIEKWDFLEVCNGLLEVSVLHIDDQKHSIISDSMYYPMLDSSRGHVDLIDPFGNVFKPGRLPTLYFDSDFNGELDATKIQIQDPGSGYRNFEEYSKDISIISQTGSGGVLEISAINLANDSINELEVIRTGYNYHASDVLLPQPPVFFNKGEEISLNAKLFDPEGEYERVAFYVNGVEVNASVQDKGNGIFGTTFSSDEPGNKFVTVRSLYGDSRDIGPGVSYSFGHYPYNDEFYGGVHYWGWKKSWTQQHFSSGVEILPIWFYQIKDYWINEHTWNRDPMWDGALSLKIGQNDVYDTVSVDINPSSAAVRVDELFHMQKTSLDAELTWDRGRQPTITHAYLYGNDYLLAEWNSSNSLTQTTQQDGNESASISENVSLGENKINFDFSWIVDFREFKEVEGRMDLLVVAISGTDRQFSSNLVRQQIRPLRVDDPESSVGKNLLDYTGENPDSEIIYEVIDDTDSNGTDADYLKTIIEKQGHLKILALADLLACYKVLYGSIPPEADGESFPGETFYKEIFVGELELDKANDVQSVLLDYIKDQLNSNKYFTQYSFLESMVGDTESINIANRNKFVSRHFSNKYGTNPSSIQKTQGSKKMWSYYNTQNMTEIDSASYFLYNLATEPVVQIGVSGTTTTYIVYTNPQINTYIDFATEMSIGISELQNGNSQNGNSQNARSKELDIFEEVVTSTNYRQRLNLLWEDSTKHQDLEYWKYESWFGHFMDEIFPWIYHTELGWLYSASTSQNNIWFYSDSMNWFWTNKEIFKNHPNLQFEEQRFIFRVRKNQYNQWEGSWSLVTLPKEGSGSSTIELYDYGYFPF